MKLLKKAIVGTCLGISSLAGMSAVNTATAADNSNDVLPVSLATQPLYVGGETLPALVMIMMSKDHSMYYEAYNDMTDLDGDNQIDGFFKPTIVYDGLFDSSICYEYSNKVFKMSKKANVTKTSDGSTVYTCNSQWSGNFLNYVTTSRMDMVKRILIGGQRGYTSSNGYMKTVQVDGYPVLVRQWIPHDTHAWVKLFHPNDIAKYCPASVSCDSSSFTPYSSKAFMLGNVQNRMFLMTFDQSGSDYKIKNRTSRSTYTLGSLTAFSEITDESDKTTYENSHMFIWNWLSRESGKLTSGNTTYPGGGVGYMSSNSQYYTGITKPGATGADNINVSLFEVQVESCHPINDITELDLGDRCHKYSSSYNTVGLLQNFSKSGAIDAYFGLITATWNRSSTDGQSSAALRAEMSDLSADINQANGNFKESSVLGVINKLALHSEGTSNYDGHTGKSWSDCNIDSGHNKRIYKKANGCYDWGNPLAPLIALSHDYFNGTLSGSVAKGSDVQVSSGRVVRARLNVSQDSKTEIDMTLPVITSASSPYASSKFYWCQTPVNLLLMDESISFDYKVGGYQSDIDAGFSIIDNVEHIKGNSYIYGEKTGSGKVSDNETIPTLKQVDDLNEVRGVSVIEPHFEGSLKGAALAAQYYATKLDPTGASSDDKGKFSSIQNIVVSMASYLPQFTIYTGNNKKVLFIPICKSLNFNSKSTGRYLKSNWQNWFQIVYDAGENYTAACSVGDIFYVGSTYNSDGNLSGVEFRTTYEDNEAGSDFDMDVGISYKIEADSSNKDLINVTTTGYYSDSYASQIAGFVIVGTEGIYSLPFNGKQSLVNSYNSSYSVPDSALLSNSNFKQNNRTYYFDISKTSNQDGSSHSTASFTSDPFFELNYLGNGGKSVVQFKQSGTISSNSYQYCFDSTIFNGRPRLYDGGTTISSIPLLPRVGAASGGTTVYCKSSVTRSFYVPNGADGAFLESPLYYAAKYGYKKTDLSNYYYVTNASTLAEKITQAMEAAISSGSKSSTAMSFSSVETSSDSAESIMAKFDSTYWTGDVNKVKLSMTDTAVTSQNVVWSVDDNLKAVSAASRKIYIAKADGSLVSFTKDNLISSSGEFTTDANNVMGQAFPRLNAGLTDTFGLSGCDASDKVDFVEAYVNYVRGDATYEVAEDADSSASSALNKCGVVGFHERNGGKLGAVITSTPQVVTVSSLGKVVLFAANDGMVHFVSESTGEELLAIIPYVAQYGMPSVARKDSTNRYVLDGEIKVSTINVGSTTRIVAVGSTGLTNPGMYALDLNKVSSNPTSSKLILWELTKSEEQGVIHHVNALGSFTEGINIFAHTVGTGDDAVTKAYAVFGNGYNSNIPDSFTPFGDDVQQIDSGSVAASDGQSGLIVVNVFTGKVLSFAANSSTGMVSNDVWSSPNCLRSNGKPSSSNTMYQFFYDSNNDKCYANGMNSSVAAYDADHDGSPDIAYSTDLYGNVYRTNMYTEPVKNWVMTKIHTAVVNSSTTNTYSVQPITTKPAIASGASGLPFVVVGTGRYLTTDDVKNEDLQSIWGLDDSNYSNDSTSAIICSSDNVSDLETCRSSSKLYSMYMSDYVGTVATSSDTENFRNIERPTDGTGGTVSYDTDQYNGWVIDMTATYGERVVVSPTVADKHAYVTTMIPSDNPCNAGGTSHMYDINILTGYFYTSPEASQLYSEQIMSKSTLTYSKGMTEEERSSSSTSNEPRKRGSNSYGCASVSNWTQINGGEAKKMVGPEYCPRVESWQYIFN